LIRQFGPICGGTTAKWHECEGNSLFASGTIVVAGTMDYPIDEIVEHLTTELKFLTSRTLQQVEKKRKEEEEKAAWNKLTPEEKEAALEEQQKEKRRQNLQQDVASLFNNPSKKPTKWKPMKWNTKKKVVGPAPQPIEVHIPVGCWTKGTPPVAEEVGEEEVDRFVELDKITNEPQEDEVVKMHRAPVVLEGWDDHWDEPEEWEQVSEEEDRWEEDRWEEYGQGAYHEHKYGAIY